MKSCSSYALALLVSGVALSGAALQAQKPAAPAPAAAPAEAPKKWVEPVKGTAVIQLLKPTIKVVGKEVVTTIKLKNGSAAPVAGLRIDEYWYDKGGSMLGGDTYRHKRLLQPGEVLAIELKTPKDPKMNANSYQFTHANGKCQVDTVKKLD
jgi:hypothetical protein